MSDLISRKALLTFIDKNFRSYWDYPTVEEVLNIITNSPAIEKPQEQGELVKKAVAGALEEALKNIARISHMGGLIDMSEADALRAIRKITLSYFNTKESFDESKQALATYDKISETNTEVGE